MKKQAFKSGYKISNHDPSTVRKRRIQAYEFAEATKRFLSENFDGMISVSNNVFGALNYIRISDEQTACFFRDLLSYVNEDVPIRINMCLEVMDFCISIEADGCLPISYPDISRLIRRAGDAGFNVIVRDEKLKLYVESQIVTRTAVRAISTDMLISTYRYTFFGVREDS